MEDDGQNADIGFPTGKERANGLTPLHSYQKQNRDIHPEKIQEPSFAENREHKQEER